MPTLGELAKRGQLHKVAHYLQQELTPLDFERDPDVLEERLENLLEEALETVSDSTENREGKSEIRNSKFETVSNDQNPKNETVKPTERPSTQNFEPKTSAEQPITQNLKPDTQHPTPSTPTDTQDPKPTTTSRSVSSFEPTNQEKSKTDNPKLADSEEQPITQHPAPSTSNGTTSQFRWSAESIASESHADRNEDTWQVIDKADMAVVLDGVGGSAAAAEASRWVAQTFAREINELVASGDHVSDWPAALRELFNIVNKQFGETARKDKKLAGGTTTATLAAIITRDGQKQLAFSTVGDSRVSIWHKATNKYELSALDDQLLRLLLSPLERRPSWLKPLLMKHGLKPELKLEAAEAARLATVLDQDPEPGNHDATAKFLFEERAIVTQVLGAPAVNPHTGILTIASGDRILLATDGIHDNLTERELVNILSRTEFEETASALVVRAQEIAKSSAPRAKKDDMTAVVLEIS